MIAIIDYGMGNLASVEKALSYINAKCIITSDHELISEASIIILPGVGSFSQGMANLKDKGLDILLTKLVKVEKKPFVGICLGLQLIFEFGFEPAFCKGLSWIEGKVIKIEDNNLRVPHMGWNNITSKNSKYLNDFNGCDFYFIHSFHVVPANSSLIAATVNYGSDIVAAVENENIFAMQFHPEKSQASGLKLLKSFIEKNA